MQAGPVTVLKTDGLRKWLEFDSTISPPISFNMTISIYHITPHQVDPCMFFDFNNPKDYTRFTNEDNVDAVDIHVITNAKDFEIGHPKSKMFLSLGIWHNYENQRRLSYRPNPHPMHYTITNAVDDTVPSVNLIHNDFLFNRTKAYYSGYVFAEDTEVWYHKGNDYYVLPDIYQSKQTKIFLAPCRANTVPNIPSSNRSREFMYRRLIYSLLKNHSTKGYASNYEEDVSSFLVPHGACPNANLLVDVQNLVPKLVEELYNNDINQFGYSPVHNLYYQDTFISIYAETIEYGTTIAVTEKTYDPLIKGHFVLPFSTHGFIKYLRTLGFSFPEFIDYSYDDEVDDGVRFQRYVEEVNRLLEISVDEWHQLRADNMQVIVHNTQLFKVKPYDIVDFSQILL
jgi:hypothetical protein